MKKGMANKLLIILFCAGFIFPALPAEAKGPNYTFRSTVAGSGIKNVDGNVHKITDERYNFCREEDVYVLTRIFNITNVSSFKFRHEIKGHGFYDSRESQVFRPNRKWWQETYYWHKFENLPAGSFELNTYIQIDGGHFKYVNARKFSVDRSGGRDCDQYRCDDWRDDDCRRKCQENRFCRPRQDLSNYCQKYRRPEPSYKYDWTDVGRGGFKDLGNGNYMIAQPTVNFYVHDEVYALTKINYLYNIERFKIKHEVYRDGWNYFKADETPEQRPNKVYWEKFYAKSNLGRLPAGNHEIRVYISLNGGAYQHLNTRKIVVKDGCDYYNGRCFDYRYDWSRTDHEIRQIGMHIYDTINPRSDFYTDERVVVLTKLADIKGIEKFKIRHELYRDNYTLVKANDSDERWPRYDAWSYNYSWTDFGRLSAGDYSIRALISVNSGSFINLDTKYIRARDRYCQNYPSCNY